MLETQQSVTQAAHKNAPSNSFAAIRVLPIPGQIGAEVDCGDVNQLTPEASRELRQAWLDNLVLLVRNQRLDDQQLLAFSRHFGELEKAPVASVAVAEIRPDPYIAIISNVVENGIAIGSLGNDEAIWHTDMSHHESPPAASILHALEIPGRGGETGFVNMYLALETMAPDLRKRIASLTLCHDGSYNSAGVRRRVSTSMDHPIIVRHPETGCEVLYLGRRPHARINGLPENESEALLDELWKHATDDRFAWHHNWKTGDILIWDNRCVMHHRNPFDAGARRIMHRAQTVGTRPVVGANAPAVAKHPRSRLATH